MSIAVLEMIRRDVLTTLAGTSTQAGYANTLTAEGIRPTGNSPADGKCIVEIGDEENATDDQGATTITIKRVQVVVTCYAIEEERAANGVDPVDIDDRLTSLAADIEKALTQDEESFHRGGHADGTYYQASRRFQGGEGPDGQTSTPFISVIFLVEYRHAANDPFTL